jgi:hypothetical protein
MSPNPQLRVRLAEICTPPSRLRVFKLRFILFFRSPLVPLHLHPLRESLRVNSSVSARNSEIFDFVSSASSRLRSPQLRESLRDSRSVSSTSYEFVDCSVSKLGSASSTASTTNSRSRRLVLGKEEAPNTDGESLILSTPVSTVSLFRRVRLLRALE